MSAGPSPPVVSLRGEPSVRPEPSPERGELSESPTPLETVGGWVPNLSMMCRSSAALFTAVSVSVDSTWLLMPAPTKVDQLVDQSLSNAPLIRISASASPAPAARKSVAPLSP